MAADSMIITISWDDGHPLDLRLAEMLAKHGLPATFYVPIENPERPLMPSREVRGLAQAGFEIGGHTYHHTRLLNVPLARAEEEIVSGKAALEDLLGGPALPFCYVGGQHSPPLARLVRQAGFNGARTTARHHLWQPGPKANRYAAPTTLQMRPYTRFEELAKMWEAPNAASLLYVVPEATGDLARLARRWLERAANQGGVWHLWGHSWEIEKYGKWVELEAILRMAAETRGRARWLTNGQLFAECAEGEA
jgi:peptidoglycan/xylan/chitin deacetylase (PgdA/CDA1 family)